MEEEDLYALLEVESNATPKQIKIAYRKRIRKYHPDINKSKEAEKLAKKINHAYTILSDPFEREKYDIGYFAFHVPTRNYKDTTVTPQDIWDDISETYKEAQRQQEDLMKNKTRWEYKGTKARSKVKKVRVKTSDGYFDIEFRS